MTNPRLGFTVDTHLFRELGELLVGRDSTALIELIKNAYDADATEIVVSGHQLADSENGVLQLRDTGIGMSREEFERGFLRVASRLKESRSRRSPLFERQYTGAKGLGRLAAHKLARFIEITSTRWNNEKPQDRLSARLTADPTRITATIDWDKIEQCETLDEIPSSGAIVIRDEPAGKDAAPGTTITLRGLRRGWTPTQHGRFLEEVQMFGAPDFLRTKLPDTVRRQTMLFDDAIVRDVMEPFGREFNVKLEGELAPSDSYWQPVLEAAQWILEIDAVQTPGKVSFAVAPTEQTRVQYPDAEAVVYKIPHPSPSHGPFFQARVLIRPGLRTGDDTARAWAARAAGIRVFMEGFRVLPYGEPRNDWLLLDHDYASRSERIGTGDRDGIVPLIGEEPTDVDGERAGLLVLPNKQYFGAVFLTQRHSTTLQTLVNREGFVPNAAYETLTSLLRTGIDIATRKRAATTAAERAGKRAQRARRQETVDGGKDEKSEHLIDNMRASIAAAHGSIISARTSVSAGDASAAAKALQGAAEQLSSADTMSKDLAYEQAMLRVLASIGTQFAAFTHEINGLLGSAEAAERFVDKLREKEDAPELARQKKSFGQLHKMIGDIRRNLERQASYLVDVVTPDARRRRSRQRLADRLDSAARLVQHAAERREITIDNALDGDLKSPPMYPAELTTLFSNLLTNAVKFAGKGGRVRATGRRLPDGRVTLKVENTGDRVDLTDAERWFRPFESKTTEVDAVLGQGMGLGLTITRRMLEDYGATIVFVRPSARFATALEITFPNS